MFWRATWQVFLAGALSGAVLTAGTGAVFVWWKSAAQQSAPQRSAEEEMVYDGCLAQGRNTASCDALLRILRASRNAVRPWEKYAPQPHGPSVDDLPPLTPQEREQWDRLPSPPAK
jgi:hypothetical protein